MATTSNSRVPEQLREHNGSYHLHFVKRLDRLCWRTNVGHKVFFVELGRPVLPVVGITFP